MKKKLIMVLGFVFSLSPLLVFAQNTEGCDALTPEQASGLQGFICKIGNVLDTLIPILIVLGIVYFVWGVITYMIAKDEEAKKRGKDKIIYGIIGLVVIVSMWGLVKIITNTFGLTGSATIITPQLPI